MKKWGILLASLAGLVLLVVLAIGIYFSQPVQHWIVARLVDPREGDTFSIEHARVGLTRTEIEGFVLERPDIGYRVDFLSADLSVLDIFFRDHVNLAGIEASGLEFDFTRFWDVPRPEDPDPLEGILGELDVPVRLTIGTAAVEGRVLLPGAGDEPMNLSFDVTGGGIDVGETGRFEAAILIEDPAAEGWLRELAARVEIALHQDEAGRFDYLEAGANLSRFGEEPPFEEELIAEVVFYRETGHEEYEGTLFRRAAGEEPRRLASVEATFTDGDRVIDGAWEAWAERGEFGAFVFAERLPEFAGTGQGTFSFNTDDHSFQIAGAAEAFLDELEVIQGELRRAGGLRLAGDFDFHRSEDWFRLEEIDLSVVSTETEEVLLEIQGLNPIRFHRESGDLERTGERTPLLELVANRAPVEWAGFFRDEAADQPMLIDGEIFGHLLLSTESGGFFVETVEPLNIGPVTAIAGDDVLLANASLHWNGSASWVRDQPSVSFDPLEITIGNVETLRVSGGFSGLDRTIDARVSADLAAILAGPAIGFHDLASGRLEAEVKGGLQGPLQASILFRDGLMEGAEEPIPPLHVNLEAEPAEENRWRFNAPFRFDRPEAHEEIVLSGEIGTATDPRRFDLQLTGEHLFLPELLELTEAFARPEEAEPAEAFAPHEAPFWDGWEGTVSADFVTVQLGEGFSLEEVAIRLQTDADQFSLSLDSTFLGSPVGAAANVSFFPGAGKPYRMTGDVNAPAVDVGGLFHPIQPDRPVTLEGHFAITGDLESEGENPGELLRRLGGEAHFLSDSGILRLFYTENPLVGLGLGIAGLLGGIGGELGTIIDIADELAEVPYDRIEASLERDEGLNFRLHNLQVIAPELHLRGAGSLVYEDEETDFLDQPMELDLELAARGELEELLGRAGVLSEMRDELGYRPMITGFSIEGTPADPDVNPFFAVVAQAILELSAPIPGRAAEAEQRAAPPREPEFGDPPPRLDEER